MKAWKLAFLLFALLFGFHAGLARAEDDEEDKKDEGGDSDSGEEKKEESKVVDGFTEDERSKMTEGAEKHEFQAEVNRLMDIIINSLYTDKQVFLRELISNSADALEKARFHSVQDESYLGDTKDLEVKIEFDSEAKTISIIDTGIGMTKADLINNLGTVAKSGTTNFLEAMADGADANLIGQFGVGFYSAFLIADKVTVCSKNNDDPVQHVWESSADASFTVVDDPRGNTLGRGTRVTLHLKEDAHDFLSEDKLKETAKKFSQFIQYPIYVKVKKEVDADVEEDDDDDDEKDEEEKDDVEVKDEDEDKDSDEKEKKPTKKTVHEWEQVNTQKAIWLRAKEDVNEDEYNEWRQSGHWTGKDSEDYGWFERPMEKRRPGTTGIVQALRKARELRPTRSAGSLGLGKLAEIEALLWMMLASVLLESWISVSSSSSRMESRSNWSLTVSWKS